MHEATLVWIPKESWPEPVPPRKKKLFYSNVFPKIHLYPIPLLDAADQYSSFIKLPIALMIHDTSNLCLGSFTSLENCCLLETLPKFKILHVAAENMTKDGARILQLLSNLSSTVLITMNTALNFDIVSSRHLFNHVAITDIPKDASNEQMSRIVKIGKN